jgi:hypothetical protein
MAKRKPLVSLKNGKKENGFSMRVLHVRPSHPCKTVEVGGA